MADVEREIAAAEEEMLAVRKKLSDLRSQLPQQDFQDYALTDWDGNAVRLSELFGDKGDLLVVHNMGTACPYCTMWADGLNGVLHHLENRAGFAVVSPDPPAKQRAFAEGRGWTFRMLSAEGSAFTRDAGYENDGSPMPGVSAFRKDDLGNIFRTAHAPFGPGDDFCAVWHLFDLLAEGVGNWQPKFQY